MTTRSPWATNSSKIHEHLNNVEPKSVASLHVCATQSFSRPSVAASFASSDKSTSSTLKWDPAASMIVVSEIWWQAWLWRVMRSGGERDCGEWDLAASVIVANCWQRMVLYGEFTYTVYQRGGATNLQASEEYPWTSRESPSSNALWRTKVTENNFCFVWCAWRIFHWVASLMTYRRILQASCTSPMARLNGWPLMTQKFVNLQLEVRRDTYIIVSVLSRGTERCL